MMSAEMNMHNLKAFVEQSNLIEGISTTTTGDLEAHARFLSEGLSVGSLSRLVDELQPYARLRDRVGLDVRVGSYTPPRGGTMIPVALMSLITRVGGDLSIISPELAHLSYESLHPFTDGNGRSGRALWLWQHIHIENHHMVQKALTHGFLLPFLENVSGMSNDSRLPGIAYRALHDDRLDQLSFVHLRQGYYDVLRALDLAELMGLS